MNKILLFELNEVPFRIIDNYVEHHPHSYMARFLAKCRQFETFTEDEIQLDPWISWPTLHRGVTDRQHQILHLGQTLDDDVEREYPPIWKRLKNAGAKVGVFGSLNSSTVPSNMQDYEFYLPDYFAGDAVAWPESLLGFQKFNLRLTRQSSRNVSRSVPLEGAFDFAKSLVTGGLTLDTVAQVSSHLVQETLDKSKRIRRRALQPLLMCDLFLHQVAETKPDFATFYTNHVAAAMHRYWAALLPEDYDANEIDSAWVTSYRDEIPFAIQKLESMLGKIVRFLERNPEYRLLVASSLGQAAIHFRKTFDFLTILDVGKLMSALGISSDAWSLAPAMAPCTSVQLHGIDHLSLAERLKTIRIDGVLMEQSSKPDKRLCFDIREGYLHLFIQFDSYAGPQTLTIADKLFKLSDCGIGTMAHEDGVNCTAQHIPNGTLLIYDPERASANRALISTVDVVPSLLQNYNQPVPANLPGRASLVF